MSQIKAKTIEIYLPTGDATKTSQARITTEAIRIVFVQKAEIDAQKRELDNMGCYILLGRDDDGSHAVYIGETENLYDRLVSHKREKDFWDSVYTIQNLGGTFDKAHLTYLEQLMIEKAKVTDRYRVLNGNKGKKTRIPESKMNECLIYFDTIQTLVKALGFHLFMPEIEEREKIVSNKFYFQSKDNEWNAQGVFIDEKMIILKGSIARKEPTKHKINSREHKFRDKLIDEGVIKLENNRLIFSKDYAFASPSTAADVVSLGSNNGWTVWKDIDGKTLNDVYRKNIVI
ncbi:MAG: GIY-YIG nuclease family protein [Paracholeplasma sp.]|nr:GIY-YIG nuclease family protein [Paracholeplasma sp.]MDY3195494.1 GIY-YIG nuclease family protein [Paracholeplasma sp.]